MTQPAEAPKIQEKDRRPVRNGFLIGVGGLAAGLTAGILMGNSLAATTPTHVANGVVYCANGETVSGIYVVAGGENAHDPTSGFATPNLEPGNPSSATYSHTIDTTWYTLHVGCGFEMVKGKSDGNWEDLGYLAASSALQADLPAGVECPTVMIKRPYHNQCLAWNPSVIGAPVGVLPTTTITASPAS